MATFVTLTVPVADIIGADYDSRRTAVYIEANTPNSVILVDGDPIRAGGRRENLVDGVATFPNLVATNSADKPTSFEYIVTIVFTPKGSQKGKPDTITTSGFPLTTTRALDSTLEEAWDNITAPPSWRSDFLDQVNQLTGIDDTDSAIAYAMEYGSTTAPYLAAKFARKGSNGRIDLGLGTAATQPTTAFEAAGAVNTAQTALQTQINAWTPSGLFRGTWSNAIAYAQGNQVVHVDTTYAANAATTAGDTPGVSSKWTVIPSIESQTARIANITRISGAVTGAWYTNLALIPVPHPSPAPSTGWGHSGNSAGTNSRLATTGPDPITAPAVYRRTFSDIPTTSQGISYVVTGLTAGKVYSFRMAGRTSWNSRRLMQVTYRNASNVEIGSTYSSPWSSVIPAGSGGTWHTIGFTPPAAAPAGAVEAVIRCMAEIGGASQSLTLAGNTVDGSAVTVVEGSVPPPFFTGDSTLGWWLGTKGVSQSRGFTPATQAVARPKVINIAPDGGDHTTIQAGVDAAADGDTLLIYPGEYREAVSAYGKHDLHLRGMSRDKCVIIDSSGAYSTPCLEIGSGSVRSLTLISDHATAGTDTNQFEDQRGYTIHADSETAMTGRTLIIEDCTLRNSRRAAIGSGLWQDCTVTVRRCDIWSGVPTLGNDRNRGAVYFHNRTTNTGVTTNQHLILEDNKVFCDDATVFNLYDGGLVPGNSQSIMDVLCIRNTFWSAINGAANTVLGGNGLTANVTLHPASYGNNVAVLNA